MDINLLQRRINVEAISRWCWDRRRRFKRKSKRLLRRLSPLLLGCLIAVVVVFLWRDEIQEHFGSVLNFAVALFSFLLISAGACGGYMAPTLIAGWRRHPDALAIGLCNLLLGWTICGWIMCLVCALVDGPEVLRRDAAR